MPVVSSVVTGVCNYFHKLMWSIFSLPEILLSVSHSSSICLRPEQILILFGLNMLASHGQCVDGVLLLLWLAPFTHRDDFGVYLCTCARTSFILSCWKVFYHLSVCGNVGCSSPGLLGTVLL